mgnify:CR=1 FL=1
MDYMFYDFMNNAKTEANRAVIESIQAGYLLCEYNRGNLTQAQYESLLGDAKNWVVDKAKSIGGTVKTGIMAAALGAIMTACAGQYHFNPGDAIPTTLAEIEDVIEDQTNILNNYFDTVSSKPIQVQEIQQIGKHCAALISAEIAKDPNAYTSMNAITDTPAYRDYLQKLYNDIRDGKVVTPEIQNAIQTTQNSTPTADSVAANAQAINKEIQKAVNALILTVRSTENTLFKYVQPELERGYQKELERRKATNPKQQG